MSKLQLQDAYVQLQLQSPFFKKEIKMCDVGCCVRCQILRKWSTSTEKNSKEHEEDLHWSTYLLITIQDFLCKFKVGHETTYASSGNKHFFTKACHRQTKYQNYEQPPQRLENSDF